MPARNAHPQQSSIPEVLFHEPDPTKPPLQLVQPPEPPEPRPRSPRARRLKQPNLSAKVDSDTFWRLTLYCDVTGYGLKDAVVSAATGYLGWGPYPRRVSMDAVREAADRIPFERYQTKKTISPRLDPALIEAISKDAANIDISESAWVEDALKRLFDHMHLPSKQFD